MVSYINKTHFSDLNACDPGDVVQRTGCGWDPETRQYTVSVWGYSYRVDTDRAEIIPEPGAPEAYEDMLYLFIIFYLIRAKGKPAGGEWISEKDIPGGAGFFRGPHTIPVIGITRRVGDDLDLFDALCRKLGGRALDLADRSWYFEITPQVRVALLYWQGDEDFGCEAKMLFDQAIGGWLPLDIVFALAVEVCRRVEGVKV